MALILPRLFSTTTSRSFVDPWSHPPALGGQNGGGADKAGDILNFLPVAAAAAAVAANGNCKFGFKSNGVTAPKEGDALERGLFAKSDTNGCLLNGHDLNGSSELFTVAAKLLNGTIAGGGGVGGASAAGASPLGNGGGGGAGGNGCQDPSVSTTQVTIPKDVSTAEC